jgi:hypothetical protein
MLIILLFPHPFPRIPARSGRPALQLSHRTAPSLLTVSWAVRLYSALPAVHTIHQAHPMLGMAIAAALAPIAAILEALHATWVASIRFLSPPVVPRPPIPTPLIRQNGCLGWSSYRLPPSLLPRSGHAPSPHASPSLRCLFFCSLSHPRPTYSRGLLLWSVVHGCHGGPLGPWQFICICEFSADKLKLL